MVAFVVLLYHWYVAVPIPLVYANVKEAGVPPTQMLWVAVGWVLIVGSATAITAATFDVIVPQAEPDKVISQ